MKKRKILVWVLVVLTVLLLAFLSYSFSHPKAAFPVQKYILYIVGALYLVVMVIIFNNQFNNRSR